MYATLTKFRLTGYYNLPAVAVQLLLDAAKQLVECPRCYYQRKLPMHSTAAPISTYRDTLAL